MKGYFGGARYRTERNVSDLFKHSSGGYYHPQYMLIENYCLNIQ